MEFFTNTCSNGIQFKRNGTNSCRIRPTIDANNDGCLIPPKSKAVSFKSWLLGRRLLTAEGYCSPVQVYEFPSNYIYRTLVQVELDWPMAWCMRALFIFLWMCLKIWVYSRWAIILFSFCGLLFFRAWKLWNVNILINILPTYLLPIYDLYYKALNLVFYYPKQFYFLQLKK